MRSCERNVRARMLRALRKKAQNSGQAVGSLVDRWWIGAHTRAFVSVCKRVRTMREHSHTVQST